MVQLTSRRSELVKRACRDLSTLPLSRTVRVRGEDGTRLHTRVFGPEDGYPIVLSHGITCSHRVWTYQIADLAADHRVIVFDHRGHGRSSIPGPDGYSLDLLAGDLNAVLDATLRPGERAVIAGHSMGGITIAAWSHRYRGDVGRRADAVALINTTTGDLLREVKLVNVPEALSAGKVLAGRGLMRTVGALSVPSGIQWASRWFVRNLAVGTDADPALSTFVHEMFLETVPEARGGCVDMLIHSVGPEHLRLDGLDVPALVIGSEKDRLLPLTQSRRIAENVPNLAGLVELGGGHCSILERPGEVNRELRQLVAASGRPQRATS